MVQYGWPVVPLERNLYGHPLAGLLLECLFVHREKGLFFICVCGWHQFGWNGTKHWSDVETTQQRSRFGRTNIFPGSRILRLHSTTMWNKQRYCGQLQKYVWIQNLCWSYRKATLFWETWHKHFLMFLWYGRSCKEMRGKILRTGEQKQLNNSTKYQLRAPMIIILEKKNWNPWDNCQNYALKLF